MLKEVKNLYFTITLKYLKYVIPNISKFVTSTIFYKKIDSMFSMVFMEKGSDIDMQRYIRTMYKRIASYEEIKSKKEVI